MPADHGVVLAQQAQQQVLGFDVRRAELAGLIARKEDHAPRLFGIALEHKPPKSGRSPNPRRAPPGSHSSIMAEYRANRELRENCASAGCTRLQLALFFCIRSHVTFARRELKV